MEKEKKGYTKERKEGREEERKKEKKEQEKNRSRLIGRINEWEIGMERNNDNGKEAKQI
jgi:hypothetical protein